MHTLSQVSKITGIPHATLRTRINRGTLKAKKLGRDWVISNSQLKNLLPTPTPTKNQSINKDECDCPCHDADLEIDCARCQQD